MSKHCHVAQKLKGLHNLTNKKSFQSCKCWNVSPCSIGRRTLLRLKQFSFNFSSFSDYNGGIIKFIEILLERASEGYFVSYPVTNLCGISFMKKSF